MMTLKHWLARWTRNATAVAAIAMLALAMGCGGDEGNNSETGADGDDQAAAGADDSADKQGDENKSTGDNAAELADKGTSPQAPQSANDDTSKKTTSTGRNSDVPPGEMPAFAVYIPEDALVAVVVHPSRFLGSSLMKALGGIDEQLAAAEQSLSLDPRNIERVVAASKSLKSPSPDQLEGIIVASFKEPIDVAALIERAGLTEKTEKKTHNGKEYLRVPVLDFAFPASASPRQPGTKIDLEGTEKLALGVYAIDEKNYLLGPEASLKAALERTEAKGPLANLLARTDLSDDLTLVLTLEGQDELIQMLKSQLDPEQLPTMLKGLAQLPDQVLHVTLSMGVTGERLLRARVETREEKGAAMIYALAGMGIGVMKMGYSQQRTQMLQQPGMEEIVASLDELIKGINVEREGSVATLEVAKPEGYETMLAKLTGVAKTARQAARLATDKNTIKQIGLAMHNFHDTYKQFPPSNDPTIRDADGNPKMSWRVYLLPYVAQAPLYDRLKRDESWDSEHNKPILTAAMPFYESADDTVTTKTRFRMFSGEGTMQPPKGAVRLRDITDGTSNTIMAIQVGPEKAAEWYKPGTGIPIDSKDLIAELGEPTPKGWLVVYCDGHAGYLRPDIDAETLKALVTIAGGEVVEAGK
jgi:hypothetical protein